MSATDTIDVAALVERLRDFQHTPHEGDPMVDMLLDMTAEAATALQSQADALAEAKAGCNRILQAQAKKILEVTDRATTAEASLATMREALEEWRAARLATLAEPVADVRKSETFAKALNRLAEAEDGLARALGGSNAE